MPKPKKILALCLLLSAAALSFAQIHKGEADTKNGTASFLLHHVEYLNYRYLFYIDGVTVFLDEANMEQLLAALDKFAEWEEIARSERVTLTKTIDSITFTSFHYDHSFSRSPVTFYLVFTGGPPETADSLDSSIPGGADIGTEANGAAGLDIAGGIEGISGGAAAPGDTGLDAGASDGIDGLGEMPDIGIAGGTGEAPDEAPSPYTLFVDTTLERIPPFRLSSKTAHEMREALQPEKLIEAWDAYQRQKALEAMFQ